MISEFNKEFIKSHALEEFPKECCGIILSNNIIRCDNVAEHKEKQFIIDSSIVQKYKEDIISIYHSHPNEPTFSQSDIYISEKLDVPYVLYDCKSEQFSEYMPRGTTIPYEGRPFLNGVFDCIELTREFYREKLNILINGQPEHPYRYYFHKWITEETKRQYSGETCVQKFLNNNGFVEVATPKKHDILTMSSALIPAPINLAIYLKNNTILHYHRNMSRIDIYSNYFRKFTDKIFRHRSLI